MRQAAGAALRVRGGESDLAGDDDGALRGDDDGDFKGDDEGVDDDVDEGESVEDGVAQAFDSGPPVPVDVAGLALIEARLGTDGCARPIGPATIA